MLGAVLGGAFLGGLADRMKENREYTKSKSDAMQEYLWKSGLKRQQEVQESRTKLEAAYDYLDSKGLDKESSLGILSENPKELLRIAAAAQAAELKGRLTETILNDAVIQAANYAAPSDVSAADLIKQATPDFVTGAKIKKPEQQESTILGKIFSPKDLEDVMYDVYSSNIMGVTGADIEASVSAPTIRGRKEGPLGVTTDLGVLAEQEDYTVQQINEMEKTVQGRYDESFAEIQAQTLNILSDYDSTIPDTQQVSEDLTLGQVREKQKEIKRIENLLNNDKDYEAYKAMMKLDPSIALSFIARGGLAANVFTNDLGFGLDQTYLDTLSGD